MIREERLAKAEERRQTNPFPWFFSCAPPAAVAVAFLLFGARLFRLISEYAVDIFFSDQWAFNDATLFQKHTVWQMFTWQHGPHRQGLGALFANLIEPYFLWNSRIESFVVGGVIAVAALCALHLKKRLYGSFSVFDVLIPALFFIPAQFETLFVTANFAHGPFPLLLIMLYCLAWTCPSKLFRYPTVLIVNFVTIYTGFGLLLGLITPALLLLEDCSTIPEERLSRKYLTTNVVVSLASLGSFFIGYKFDADLACFSPQARSPELYVAYAAFMFSHFFAVPGFATFRVTAGLACLTALLGALASAVWQLLHARKLDLPGMQQKRLLIAVTLIAYCLLFCMSTAYGRVCGGLWTARASRYVIYVEIGILGLYFQLLSARRLFVRSALVAGLLVAVLAASSYVDRSEMGYFAQVKRRWKRCYLMTENANLCSQAVGFPIYTHAPEGVHLQEKLDYLKETRQNLYANSR